MTQKSTITVETLKETVTKSKLFTETTMLCKIECQELMDEYLVLHECKFLKPDFSQKFRNFFDTEEEALEQFNLWVSNHG